MTERSSRMLIVMAAVLIALAIPFFIPMASGENTTLAEEPVVQDGLLPGTVVAQAVDVDYSSSTLNVTAVLSGNVIYATSPVPAIWDMGDGTVYTDRTNITHVFEKGVYAVKVTAADGTAYAANVTVSSEIISGELITHLPEVLILLGIIILICTFLPIPGLRRNPVIIVLGLVILLIGAGLHFDVFASIKTYLGGLL